VVDDCSGQGEALIIDQISSVTILEAVVLARSSELSFSDVERPMEEECCLGMILSQCNIYVVVQYSLRK